ncbi:MAG: MFS transporter [Chloroflexota bacterium]|nr:MFS transporter [Anaerolineales bacterium]
MTNQVLTPSALRQSRFPGVLQYPKFTVLWLSETVSLIGDRILLVALIALIYQQTQSAASVGLLSMLKALPALLLGTLAGVFVDRWSRKWTMVTSNLLQGLLVLLIPLTNSLPLIFGVYLGMAIINQFFFPARAATIPDLVPQEMLLSANSLFAIGMVLALVIGPAIGGWISDRFGLDIAFYVDAVTFLVPTIAVGCLALPQTKRDLASQALAGEWRDGFRLVRGSPDIQAALLLMGAAMMQIASLAVLGIIILDRQFGVGAAGLGALMSSVGVGMLVGSIVQNFLKRRFSHRRLAAVGAVFAGVNVTLLPWMPYLVLCLFCTFELGMGFAVVQANAQTILQNAPEGMRGRVLGMAQAITGSVTFLTAGLMGILVKGIGMHATFMISGMAAAISGGVVLWSESHLVKSNPE